MAVALATNGPVELYLRDFVAWATKRCSSSMGSEVSAINFDVELCQRFVDRGFFRHSL